MQIVEINKGEALASAASEDDTQTLGRLLARALPEQARAQNVLLNGPLGAGKTTLTRGLVSALPGGDKAQVSSPSFNIVNYYPTEPECAHFDLYRLEGFAADESLMEAFAAGSMLVIVEWAEHLEQAFKPEERLELTWTKTSDEREIRLTAAGEAARRYLESIIAQR